MSIKFTRSKPHNTKYFHRVIEKQKENAHEGGRPQFLLKKTLINPHGLHRQSPSNWVHNHQFHMCTSTFMVKTSLDATDPEPTQKIKMSTKDHYSPEPLINTKKLVWLRISKTYKKHKEPLTKITKASMTENLQSLQDPPHLHFTQFYICISMHIISNHFLKPNSITKPSSRVRYKGKGQMQSMGIYDYNKYHLPLSLELKR